MTGASFFEGTEKKVELVTDPSVRPLRELGDEFWAGLAGRAGATVLSKICNGRCDAYLLSESSLFVFDHKMLMITCGRTRPPEAVAHLLEVVPPEQVRFFVYERKNEVFPHSQPTSFFDDVRGLNRRLPGKAFQFGDEDDHHLYLFHLDRAFEGAGEDSTVEILMYGLDTRERFAAGSGSDTAAVRAGTGVDRILSGFRIDDHRFEPRGYSLNGIRDEHYWTVHVTPDAISSYASFETNYPIGDGLPGLVDRVVEVFRPRSFDVVLFDRPGELRLEVARYRLCANVARDLDCGYRVAFLSFRSPYRGVQPPVELPVG
jgi:S-adenosylmethionine decarboxylase